MKDIIPAKKESPILGLSGLGGGVGSNLGGSLAEKTYVDEVFNTKCYIGNATERTITTGIDLAGEGGLLWFKNRDNSNQGNYLNDTTSLPQTSSPWYSYPIFSNSAGGRGPSANGLKSFNSDGFTIQTDTHCNGNGNYQVAWSFRKAPGFFDVVTWTGNGSTRQISHDLGSVPGCIMVKNLTNSRDWAVWHRGVMYDDVTRTLILNAAGTASSNNTYFDNGSTPPTATNFTVHTSNRVNATGDNYVAYVFAGGESDADTAKSIYVDGAGDWLSTGSSGGANSDFAMGASSDFTIECWVRFKDTSNRGVFQISDSSNGLSSAGGGGAGGTIAFAHNGTSWHVYGAGSAHNKGFNRSIGQWYHVAYCRSSGVTRCFVDGEQILEWADTYDYAWNYSATHVAIGGYYTDSYLMQGDISNFRIVKGTALYTGGFRPPTEPLKNITNTVLLCCNGSTTTSSTVNSGGTITSHGGTTAITSSPFDDSDAFKFGEGGDQQIIKCGRYEGYGSERYINIGFEPQWVLVKNMDFGNNWVIADSIRGAADKIDNAQKALFPNLEQQDTSGNYIGMTSRGFKLLAGESSSNTSNQSYLYIAIRRPDGLVGKPIETGTDAFTMVYGKNDNTLPTFVSPHVTDFTLFKNPTSNGSWYTQERIHGQGYMLPNTTAAEANSGNNTWDFSNGFYKATGNWSTDMNWMWQRHAGFDVVNWTGTGHVDRHVHNLGQAPEFMIVKRRSATEDWTCYHKGLNGGTNPSHYYIQWNGTSGQGTYTNYEPGNPGNFNLWNREEPTSTHFTVGEHDRVNTGNQTYMALLFSSVTGISKCGNWVGDGGTQTITLGFQPRFLMFKTWNTGGGWYILDTNRGWGSGNDASLQIQETNAQDSGRDDGAPTATGFTVTGDVANEVGRSYIYYAHA